MKNPFGSHAIIAIRAGIAVVLVLFALAIFQVLANVGPQVATVNPDEARQRVNVFTAQPVAVQRQWMGYGTVEAIDSANVPARVTATVASIPNQTLEGSPVKRGQLLVGLDDTDFVNQVSIAKENLAAVEAQLAELDVTEASLTERRAVETRDVKLAEDELERIRKMFEGNAANQKDLDAAERALLAAQRNKITVDEALDAIGPRRRQLNAQKAGLESSLRIAQENLDRCTIQSPIDGVIQFVDVEVGESVAPGERVARVVKLDRVQVPLGLPAKARSFVRVGGQVLLRSTADPDQTWAGEVVRITPEDDPGTRTFAVYVEVDQADADRAVSGRKILSPGVFVSGAVQGLDRGEKLIVPRRSIRTERVMLVRDAVLYSSPVKEAYAYEGPVPELGLPDEQWAVIESGVEAGDVVVLNPTRSLSDGQHIEPIFVSGAGANAVAGGVESGSASGNDRGDTP